MGKMERPASLQSTTQRVETGFGRVYVTISHSGDGDMFEVFVHTGNSGGVSKSWCESLGKTLSNALRSGADAEELADDLVGIRAGRVDYDNDDVILSIPDAVGVAMKRHLQEKQGESIRGTEPEVEMP